MTEDRAAIGPVDRRGTILVSGGGTAGHVVPGLAIGRALVRRGWTPDQIHYVGSERGIEVRMVPEAGFPLTVLPGRGIARRVTLSNVGAVFGLFRAVAQAAGLVRRMKPRALVALGGYASVPCVVWAVMTRVPIVVAEQNAVPGLANRIASRFARASAVSFPGTPLPRAVWTGNPVRPEVIAVDRVRESAEARAVLGIDPSRRVVAVFGGSLGARRINDGVVAALEAWRDRDDLAVRHVIGERDFDVVIAAIPDLGAAALQYQPVRFESDMPNLYRAADVVVCRSGATTVAELAIVGVPAVLVPLPGAPGDHQTANARSLVDAGASVLVPDDELSGDRLAAEVDGILSDAARADAMASAGRSRGRPDAADRVADLIEDNLRAHR